MGSLGLDGFKDALLVEMDSDGPAPLDWAAAADLVGGDGRRRRGRQGREDLANDGFQVGIWFT